MKILVIEDDEQIAAVLSEMLTAHHYVVEHATDGKTGLDLAQAFTYELIVLDLSIPCLDGLSVCRKLRKQGRLTPILVLTARDSEIDKAQGLDAGADDYVCKPFKALELLARIRALIRRSQATPTPSLTWGPLVMHPLRGEVTFADRPLALTPKEFALLELFLRNPQRIFSRSAILDQLWSYDNPPSESAVTMHIKDLRQKLKAAGLTQDMIETIYGMGYRLKTAPNPAAPMELPAALLAATGEETQAGVTQAIVPPLNERELSSKSPSDIPRSLGDPPQTTTTAKETTHPSSTPSPSLPAPCPSQSASVPDLTHLIDRFHPHFLQQITLLITLIEDQPWLFRHPPTSPLWQPVRQVVHKLLGTLGTFGYTTGAALAKELDRLLRQEMVLSAAQQGQLKDLLTGLKQALDTPVSPAPKARSPVPTTVGQPKRVLIIDRDRARLDAIQALLPTGKICITIAESLSQVQQILPQVMPDLVLLDLALPSETGTDPRDARQLLQALVQQDSQRPIVVLSPEDSLEERVAVARIGGSRFLPRSTAIEQIVQTLLAILSQGERLAKILAVDDDCALLASLTSLLEPRGLQLTPLSDPHEFWQVLPQVAPDLLILDLEMPTFSGIDLCRVVRQAPTWTHLPILILTSHTDAETVQRVFAAGADDFVGKPVAGPELVTRILNRLERAYRQPPQLPKLSPAKAQPPIAKAPAHSWSSRPHLPRSLSLEGSRHE